MLTAGMDEKAKTGHMPASSFYNFISSEWYKLRKSRFFYVCCLANAAVSVLVLFSLKVSSSSYAFLARQQKGGEEPSDGLKALVQMVEFGEKGNPFWAAAYSYSNVGVMVGAILIILFVSMEYRRGTFLALFGRGYSRKKLFAAKFIVANLGVAVMQFTAALANAIAALAIWGLPKGCAAMARDMAVSIGCNTVLMFGCMAPAFLAAVVFQGSGEAVGVYVVSQLVLSNMANIGVKYSILPEKTASSFLLDNKVMQLANIMETTPVPWVEIGISLAYTAVFFVLCCIIMEEKDF